MITPNNDTRVMPFLLWCLEKGFSYSTGRRLVEAGQGPVITLIGQRRWGVQVRHDREWIEKRQITAA
jgi:hypothetical protein